MSRSLKFENWRKPVILKLMVRLHSPQLSNQKGFALVPILITAGVLLVGLVGIVAFSLGKSTSENQLQLKQSQSSKFPFFSPKPGQNQMMGENSLKSHHSYITFSDDGKTWKKGSLIRKSASVPDLIQLDKDLGKFKKGDLLVYFVDGASFTTPGSEELGIISSSDTGVTWTESGTTKFSNRTSTGGAVDPSVVQLADGSLRLYYFGPDSFGGDPAKETGKHKVYSARSTDAVNFTGEPGVRFEMEKLTDPEVIYFNNKYFMYYSLGLSSGLATSSDGLTFSAVSITGGNVGGVPGALALDSGVRLFGCRGGIQMGFASDGINFKSDGMIDIQACDPAAIKLANGKYALLYKIDENMKQGNQQKLPPLK